MTAGAPQPKAESRVAMEKRPVMPSTEMMEQGVQEPCVYCQVLYPDRFAAHCPHCNDRRIVFHPARMMSRELAEEEVAVAATRCEGVERRADGDAALKDCLVTLLRMSLIYNVGDPGPLIERIRAIDARLQGPVPPQGK